MSVKTKPDYLSIYTGWVDDCTVYEKTERVDAVKLGSLFRLLRLKANIGLNKMADQIGISPAYLSDIERGHRRMSAEKAVKFIKECQS